MSESCELPRTIVVVGGGGVAQGIATKFIKEDWNVVMVSRTASDLEAFAPKVAGGPGRFKYLAMDASEEKNMEVLVSEVNRLGGCGALVTCTGNSFLKPLPEVTLEEMHIMVRDNFQTVFLTNRAFIPQMVERGCGIICNISSKVATTGGGTLPTATYTATKSAVVGFTQALCKEYKKKGLAISVLCPGPIDTPMRRRGNPNIDPRRLISPVDVADLVYYLVQRPAMMMELPVVPLALHY